MTQTDPTRTVQRSASCRSRRELSKRIFTCKIWLRYSRERALSSLPDPSQCSSPWWSVPIRRRRTEVRNLGKQTAQNTALESFRYLNLRYKQLERNLRPGGIGCWYQQTSNGSFSAVWTAAIARKYAFCCIFQNLQDVHSFAPLKTQIFNKIVSFVCCKISNSSFAKPIS